MSASRLTASLIAVALIGSASPAFGGGAGDANVDRAISTWAKTKKKARLHFTAEGIVVQDPADSTAAYGRVGLTRCRRRALPGPRTCIGAAAIKPLREDRFQVEDDLSQALLQMRLRGRRYIVEWRSSEEDSVEPSIQSLENGRADVERDASASGEFLGHTVALTQLKAAVIEQVVDVLPEEAPVPFPFDSPDPLSLRSLVGSSRCWNHKPSERRFARKMNEARMKQGLSRLRLDPELSKVSRVHTAEMIGADLLHHATTAQLTRRVTNWRMLGENVGVGGTVSTLHDAFMNSAAHKANVLYGFNHVGVGVAKRDGRMWVTVTFAKSPNPGTTLNMPRC